MKTTGILLLAILCAATQAQAFTFNFPFPGSSSRGDQGPPPGPPPGWQFRPQDPSNARGVPPSYQPKGQAPGQMPGQAPGQMRMPGYQPGGAGGYQPGWPGQYGGTPYGRQQGRQAARPPRLEVEIGDRQPYVQENVLLKLRVVSDQNLSTATPELPNSNDLLFQKLDGPNASTRPGEGGQREIVNEFIYSVTPLRAGDLELPALSVSGETGGYGGSYGRGAGSPYEARSREKILLQVRPAMTSVRPWLPLQDLDLNAMLDGGEEVEEGQPVTLTLELTATGATGSQLPGLEDYLRSPDFRVYREQTITEGKLSADGRRLEGKRTEYYTLVPHSGGKLHLPEIRLPWWNVDNGTREYASLPVQMLQVEGESGPFGLSTSYSGGGEGLSWYWLPLVGLVLLLLGYWGGVWYKGQATRHPDREPLGARLGSGLRSAGAKASAGAASALDKLNPAPIVRRIRPALTRAMPASSRFLGCVRAANRENDPAAWAERFQETTCRRVQFDTQTPLPGISGQILRLRPNADREQVERLMRQLDGALYGNQDIDFRRWKKQFYREVGRGRVLFKGGFLKPRFRRPLLPELNPQT